MGMDDPVLAAATVETCSDRSLVNTAIVMWHGTLGPLPGWKVAFVLKFGDRVVGVSTFGRPVARLENRVGTWEHTRMALAPDVPKNTPSFFLSRNRKWIRENRPEVELLIAYVDETNHSGVTYRADNWRTVFRRKSVGPGTVWTNREGRTAPVARLRTKFERAP